MHYTITHVQGVVYSKCSTRRVVPNEPRRRELGTTLRVEHLLYTTTWACVMVLSYTTLIKLKNSKFSKKKFHSETFLVIYQMKGLIEYNVYIIHLLINIDYWRRNNNFGNFLNIDLTRKKLIGVSYVTFVCFKTLKYIRNQFL